jgi:phospholipase C
MAGAIEHVVVIFKENHTFDNFFWSYPSANGAAALAHAPDPIIPDPDHSHGAWLSAQAGGGGVKLGYDQSDIPTYWALAQQYTLCDNYFTDVASQSEPNHLFAIAADSPVIDNDSRSRTYQPQPPYDMPSLPAALQAAGRTWRNYADVGTSYLTNIAALSGSSWNVPADQFDDDVENGQLPDVAWLYPPAGRSDHPPDSSNPGPVLGIGQAWTAARVANLASGPQWASTAIFLTWDDWGGWYDHVVPPDNRTWTGGGPAGYTGSQFRYGDRVPCLVLSPYAKQGINSDFSSHASIVKFCLRVFSDVQPWGVPALAAGDPSGDMWGCFDFVSPPRLGPPDTGPVAPTATV